MARKRKNGEGTVRLRKDGRWEGRIVIGYDENWSSQDEECAGQDQRRMYRKTKGAEEHYHTGHTHKTQGRYAIRGVVGLLV